LPVANGGTGAATLTANSVVLGNGTSAVQLVAPSTSGNLLTSNGTTWVSSALSAVVTSAVAGNGITVSGATGAVTISLNFYTGTTANNTSYPIGSFGTLYTDNYGASLRPYLNEAKTCYVYNSAYADGFFYASSGNLTVSGTWRSRGVTGGGVGCGNITYTYTLMQRVA
jgi:hypothetical protein